MVEGARRSLGEELKAIIHSPESRKGMEVAAIGLYAIAWWTLRLMIHPVRTIKEGLYLGEYKHGFDPKTHRPNLPNKQV